MLECNGITQVLKNWDKEKIFINFLPYDVVSIKQSGMQQGIPYCEIEVKCETQEDVKRTNDRIVLMKNNSKTNNNVKTAAVNTEGFTKAQHNLFEIV